MNRPNDSYQDIEQNGPPIRKREQEKQIDSALSPLDFELGIPNGHKDDWDLRGESNPMSVTSRGVFTIYTEHGLLQIISSIKLSQQFPDIVLKLIVDFTADDDRKHFNIECHCCYREMFVSREALHRMEMRTECTRIWGCGCAECHQSAVFWDFEYGFCNDCGKNLGYLCEECHEQHDLNYDHPQIIPNDRALACKDCTQRLKRGWWSH